MSPPRVTICLAVAVACLSLAATEPALAAGTAPAGTESKVIKMIEAVKAGSYDDFLSEANAKLKLQYSRQQFEGLCGLYTAPLRKGYKIEYMGQLRQRAVTVLLWKVTVVDVQDEALLMVTWKDGKVDGFSVH